MAKTPAGLVSGLPSLASSSKVYDELNKALGNPDASVNDFGIIIEKDPDLTARLLRLSNSAFYGYQSTIKTVGDALMIIGIQQVRDLVAGAAVVEYFKGISTDLVTMESFWKHSVACGVAARTLARYRRSASAEQSFTAGLMHDLGRMVLFMRDIPSVTEIFKRYQDYSVPLHEIETEVLGFDHQEIGGALLKSWRVPDSLVDAVQFHHDPMVSENYAIEAALVHFGDIIAHGMEFGGTGEMRVPQPSREAWDLLELDGGVFRSCMKEVERDYKAMVEMFL